MNISYCMAYDAKAKIEIIPVNEQIGVTITTADLFINVTVNRAQLQQLIDASTAYLQELDAKEERLPGFDRCVSLDCEYLAIHTEHEASGENVKCYACRIDNDPDECTEGEEE